MAVRLVSRRVEGSQDAPAGGGDTLSSGGQAAGGPAGGGAPSGGGPVAFRALKECIQVAVQNGEICLKLPVIGDICVDIPDFVPNGTVVEACGEVKFPACIKLTVRALGQTVVNQEFGIC